MYFEILKNDKLIKRGEGRDILSTLSWDNELMAVPSFNITLPVDYLEYVDGWEDFKLYVNNKVFWGRVKDITVNKETENIELVIEHIISEWRDRQISVNNAQASKELNFVYKGDKIKKDKNNDESISAKDFTLMFNEVKGLKDSTLIARAYAKAWVSSNGDSVPVFVKQSTIKSKQDTYKVTFATEKGTEITVNCEVKNYVSGGKQRTEKNRNTGETIKAKSFTIESDTPSELTKSDLIELSEAKAYETSDKNKSVEITKVVSGIKDEPGKYDVTFSTAKGTSLKITVRVKAFSGQSITELPDPALVDKLEDIYTDENFTYPGWQLDIEDGAGSEMIDYVYSKQNKLEALTKTMELTEDLFWRVGFTNEKIVEIGRFGEEKPYTLSLKPSGKTNIRIITEPTIDYDFENVINVATVYSAKSDSGMTSLTLREVYENPDYQNPDFPVVILRENVNNERDYSKYITQYPQLAPNNALEYAIIDTEGIALEGGHVIEGSYAFNDISSFNIDGKKITDARRKRAARTAYKAAIRKLRQSRRTYDVNLTTEELPSDLMPGDKVILRYDNNLFKLDACSNYWKKILSYNDWFYVTKIGYRINDGEVEINELILSKYIKIDRETANQ